MPGVAGSALARHIATVPLIDQHVHGCWLTAGDRQRFENGLNEANTEPLADFDSGFDSQLGFAVRARCAPLLGLPKHGGPHIIIIIIIMLLHCYPLPLSVFW